MEQMRQGSGESLGKRGMRAAATAMVLVLLGGAALAGGAVFGRDGEGGDLVTMDRAVVVEEPGGDLAGTESTEELSEAVRTARSQLPVPSTVAVEEPPSQTTSNETPRTVSDPQPRDTAGPVGSRRGSGRIVRNGFWGLDGRRYDSAKWAGVREERDGELAVFERRCATDGGVARFYAVREDGSEHTWELTLSSGLGGRDPASVQYGIQIQDSEAGSVLAVPMFNGGHRDGYIHCGFDT